MKSKKIIKNSAILFVARVSEGLIQIATLAIVARYLGVAVFGEYAFVITVSFFYTVFMSFGTGNILIREISKDKAKTSEFASVVIFIRLLMSVLMLIPTVGLLAYFTFSPFTVQGFYLMFLAHFCMVIGKTFEEVYIAHERMSFIFYVALLSKIFGLFIIIGAYLLGFDNLFVYYSVLAASILRLLVSFWFCKKYFVFRFQGVTSANIRFFLKSSTALFGSMLLRQFNVRVDVFFLQALATNTQLALYHVPHRIFMNMQAVPSSVTSALFPQFSKTAEESMERLADYFDKIFKMFLISGIGVCMISHVWAEEIITLLFSVEFAGAVICFKILLWSFLTGSISSLLEILLVVVNKQKQVMVASFFGLLLNIALDVLLIPRYEAVGASYATMFSYLSVTLLMFFHLTYLLKKKSLYYASAKAIIITFIAIVVSTYVFPVNKMACTALLLVIFLGLAKLSKVISKDEALFVVNLLKNRRRLPPPGRPAKVPGK